jgi:protein TonB
LLFLIDINGRAIESQIKESSGHPRLDEAARQALSLCKFKPGTIDGKIEQVWMPLVYKFELSDQ